MQIKGKQCKGTNILVIMYLTPGIQISVLLIPVWIAILGIGYFIKQRGQQPASAASR